MTTAADWNRSYPKGTKVRYWPRGDKTHPNAKSVDMETRGSAYTLSTGSVIVPLIGADGHKCSVWVSHIEPIAKVPVPAALLPAPGGNGVQGMGGAAGPFSGVGQGAQGPCGNFLEAFQRILIELSGVPSRDKLLDCLKKAHAQTQAHQQLTYYRALRDRLRDEQ